MNCFIFFSIIPTLVFYSSCVVLVIALGSSVGRYNLQSTGGNTAG